MPFIGSCIDMCPSQEILFRKDHNMIHILESSTEQHHKFTRNKMCRERMVKEYSRPAAGQQIHERQLRTPEALIKTTDYLVNEVMNSTHVDWSIVYEFVFDRLRCVRQELVIQDLEPSVSVYVLERAVLFYLYSTYRLCNDSSSRYNTQFNETHTQECLKRLLYIYDSYPDCCDNQGLFVSIYLLYNITSTEPLMFVTKLPKKNRLHPYIAVSVKMCLSWLNYNWVRLLRLSKQLPILLQCALYRNLPNIYKHALRCMCCGFHCKQASYTVTELSHTLCLHPNEIRNILHSISLPVIKERISLMREHYRDDIKIEGFCIERIDKHLSSMSVSQVITELL